MKIKSCIASKQKSFKLKKEETFYHFASETSGKILDGLLEMTTSLPLHNDGVIDCSFTLNGPDFLVG